MRTRIAVLRREDGQALVEMALVIPLLILILFAIIDFGEALNQYNDATNLANLGARAAVVASSSSTPPTCPNGTTPASLTAFLQCEGATDSAALANVTVCPSDITPGNNWTTGDTVQVVVSSNFSWMKVLTGVSGGLVSQISSTATMREEADNTTEPSWVSTGASSSC